MFQFSNGGSGKYYVHAPDVGLVSMMMMGVSDESYYYHFDAIGYGTSEFGYEISMKTFLVETWKLKSNQTQLLCLMFLEMSMQLMIT